MSGACAELDHPADIWLEIMGPDLPQLFENALYAFYRQIVDVKTIAPDCEVAIEAVGNSVESALRALLAEALFRFETEGFLAAGAAVTVEPAGRASPPADSAAGVAPGPEATPERVASAAPGLRATARLWGERADRSRHELLAEVKAVTYHQLTATQLPEGGWRATVLFDV
jgi:SHS2 domain-containing protein